MHRACRRAADSRRAQDRRSVPCLIADDGPREERGCGIGSQEPQAGCHDRPEIEHSILDTRTATHQAETAPKPPETRENSGSPDVCDMPPRKIRSECPRLRTATIGTSPSTLVARPVVCPDVTVPRRAMPVLPDRSLRRRRPWGIVRCPGTRRRSGPAGGLRARDEIPCPAGGRGCA